MKVALVTGASSGFGEMASRELARRGFSTYAGMREIGGRNREKAEAAASDARASGTDLRTVELDVQSEESAASAIDRIMADGGRLDVLVHNAGHMTLGPSEAFTPGQLAELYDVNVLGTQRVNRAALPHMRAAGAGHLVGVSSTSAHGGVSPWLGPYFAAKAAMDSLAVTYALELIRWGIDTTIVVPGVFTGGTEHFAHAGAPADRWIADSYADGPYAGIAETMIKGFQALEPADADPTDVGRAIADAACRDSSDRPFRLTVDPSQDGAEIVNAMSDRMRQELLRRIGLADLNGDERSSAPFPSA
jgi:NAD(P)-dependent dehydrogenase (short-subunit alcohol dehydrogenase family)